MDGRCSQKKLRVESIKLPELTQFASPKLSIYINFDSQFIEKFMHKQNTILLINIKFQPSTGENILNMTKLISLRSL